MITANMHEAKSRLSALVKAVEEDGETVILCRNGKEVAEIVRRRPNPSKSVRRLVPEAPAPLAHDVSEWTDTLPAGTTAIYHCEADAP